MTELLAALQGVGVAFLAAATLAVVTATPYVPKIMRALLDRILAQIEGTRATTLKVAGETAAAAVEEDAKHTGAKGDDKRAQAVAMVQSIAPSASAAAPHGALENVVAAGVAKLRASVPNPDALAVVRLSSAPSAEALHGQVPLPKPATLPGQGGAP